MNPVTAAERGPKDFRGAVPNNHFICGLIDGWMARFRAEDVI